MLEAIGTYLTSQVSTFIAGTNMFYHYRPLELTEGIVFYEMGGTMQVNMNYNIVDLMVHYFTKASYSPKPLQAVMEILVSSGKYSDADGEVLLISKVTSPNLALELKDGVKVFKATAVVHYAPSSTSIRGKVFNN